MNEPSSFCEGSCGTFGNLSNTSQPIAFPGDDADPVTDWPEGYDPARWGISGNMTINGTLTYDDGVEVTAASLPSFLLDAMEKRALGDIDLNAPPYAIHNGFGDLSVHTVATNATHANGAVELHVHNLWGYLEERATHLALLKIRPNERPFLISRSTFPSSGVWSGHWVRSLFSCCRQVLTLFNSWGITTASGRTCATTSRASCSSRSSASPWSEPIHAASVSDQPSKLYPRLSRG